MAILTRTFGSREGTTFTERYNRALHNLKITLTVFQSKNDDAVVLGGCWDGIVCLTRTHL